MAYVLNLFFILLVCNCYLETFARNSLEQIFRDFVELWPQNRQEQPKEIQCGIRNGDLSDRIIGGVPVIKGEFPWMISFQVYYEGKYNHACGASVINSNWAVTAAHCVQGFDKSLIRLIAGIYELNETSTEHHQVRTVENIYTDNYDEKINYHDIALLKVKEPFMLDQNYVAPVCIPDGTEDFENTANFAGWGVRKENSKEVSNTPYKIIIGLETNEECNNFYSTDEVGQYYENYKNKECQICTKATKGTDGCQGDSGGSLLCFNKNNNKYYACGLASWGIGCGRPKYPSVYTEVSCYKKWINETLEK